MYAFKKWSQLQMSEIVDTVKNNINWFDTDLLKCTYKLGIEEII